MHCLPLKCLLHTTLVILDKVQYLNYRKTTRVVWRIYNLKSTIGMTRLGETLCDEVNLDFYMYSLFFRFRIDFDAN